MSVAGPHGVGEWGDKQSGGVWRRGHLKTKGHNTHVPDGKTTVQAPGRLVVVGGGSPTHPFLHLCLSKCSRHTQFFWKTKHVGVHLCWLGLANISSAASRTPCAPLT